MWLIGCSVSANESPRTMRRTLAIIICVLALIAASCSEFPGVESATPPRNDMLIDAIANELIFQADPATQDVGEAGCMARAIFGQIGASRLNDAGVTVETANIGAANLTGEERAFVAEVTDACTMSDLAPHDTPSDTPASLENVALASDQDSAVGSLIDSMVSDLLSDPNGPASNPGEARCMIEGTIEILGLDTAGVEAMAYNDREASREEHNAFVDAYSRCGDVLADFSAGLGDSGFYAAEASCVTKEFGFGNIVEMMKDSYDLPAGVDLAPADQAELLAAMNRCGIES